MKIRGKEKELECIFILLRTLPDGMQIVQGGLKTISDTHPLNKSRNIVENYDRVMIPTKCQRCSSIIVGVAGHTLVSV